MKEEMMTKKQDEAYAALSQRWEGRVGAAQPTICMNNAVVVPCFSFDGAKELYYDLVAKKDDAATGCVSMWVVIETDGHAHS